MALLRAVMALASSYVKDGSRHYSILREAGYSHLEISYANMMAVQDQTAENALRPNSIAAQKIAVALFQAVFAHEEPLTPENYQHLTEIYRKYHRFSPRCYACETLAEALNDTPHILNAKTFCWFSTLATIRHPALSGFDVLDRRWDVLASAMQPEVYRNLFEDGLTDSMTSEDIRNRIDRYDTLTQTSYLAGYRMKDCGGRFELLIRKDILNLWELFQNNLDESGEVIEYDLMSRIGYALRGMETVQSYRFYEKFIEQFGISKLEKFFANGRNEFQNSLISYSSSYGYSSTQTDMALNIKRNFLDNAGLRQVLSWLEDYIFVCKPEKYLQLAAAILLDSDIASLFSAEDQKALFQVVMRQPELSRGAANSLKEQYWTAEELRAEKEAIEIARQKANEKRELDRLESIREKYVEKTDGTFSSVSHFLELTFGNDRQTASRIVHENMDELMPAEGKTLNHKEAACLFAVCGELLKQDCMGIREAQACIMRLTTKEVDDTDDFDDG